AKRYENFIENFGNGNTNRSHQRVRGKSALNLAEQIEKGIWMIPPSSQSHDLRQQPLANPAPSGRDRAQARPHARRVTDPQHARRHRLFGAPWQSSEEGLKEGISPRPK